ncbi:MAG: Ig-like domain-containing protein [candidate division Zixibacteria bacterium]|nr:Ig-like domain-containing protein [candidate division Zixibacteria bacterium]
MKETAILIAFVSCLLFNTAVVAQPDPNDVGTADTVALLFQFNNDTTKAILEVYVYSDEQLLGATVGFTWDNANFQMDSAVATTEIKEAFDLITLFYEDDSLELTNENQRFLFGGSRGHSSGLAGDADERRLWSTYYFSVDSWDGFASVGIIFDTLEWDGGSEYLFVAKNQSDDTQVSFQPQWEGPLEIGNKTLLSFELIPPDTSICEDLSFQYKADGVFSDSSLCDVTNSVFNWSSTNSAVATVSQSGLVSAISAGETEIIASIDSIVDTATITVIPSIYVIPANADTVPAESSCTLYADTPNQPDSIKLYYRIGGSNEWSSDYMTGSNDTVSATIPTEYLNLRGIEYYFRAWKNGTSASMPSIISDDSLYLLRTSVTRSQGNIDIEPGEYQMIGFPFEVLPADFDSVIVNQFGSPDEYSWRFGRWNPVTEEYDSYELAGDLCNGYGYWIIAKDISDFGAAGISIVPDTVLYDNNDSLIGRYRVLELEQGWNQIATPFAFPIDWNDKKGDEEIDSLYSYNQESGYSLASTMEPFEGYWTVNRDNSTRILLLPYQENSSVSTNVEQPEASEYEWIAQIHCRTNESADLVNVIGVHPKATNGFDKYDFAEPPPIGKFVSLELTPPEYSKYSLGGDIRAPSDSGYRFEFEITTNSSGPISLTLVNEYIKPKLDIHLEAADCSWQTKLMRNTTITLPEQHQYDTSRFVLVVKKSDENDEDSEEIRPDSYKLYQNYPNPFNPITAIRFDIPNEGMVQLHILNVLGQHVRTLVNSYFPVGTHTAIWRGRNDNGSEVSSGVYFYRLVSEQNSISKKMLLIK